MPNLISRIVKQSISHRQAFTSYPCQPVNEVVVIAITCSGGTAKCLSGVVLRREKFYCQVTLGLPKSLSQLRVGGIIKFVAVGNKRSTTTAELRQ